MSGSEKANAQDGALAGMLAQHGLGEVGGATGRYSFRFYENAKAFEAGDFYAEEIANVVCTIGKNVMLDAALAGSSYTVTGPYIGLISSASFSAVSAADTMASHAGWLEAGNANAPTYTAPRPTASWSAASGGSKALATPASYSITGSGTVQGAFLTYGSGAVATIDSTAGTLYSAGTFSVAQPVVNGNVLTVSYSTSL